MKDSRTGLSDLRNDLNKVTIAKFIYYRGEHNFENFCKTLYEQTLLKIETPIYAFSQDDITLMTFDNLERSVNISDLTIGKYII